MWRDAIACLLCVAALCGALWLMGSDCDRAAMGAGTATRMEFLEGRVRHLEEALRLEGKRADASEATARAFGGLLDALKGAMGVGP
jgi:hypothetical protein